MSLQLFEGIKYDFYYSEEQLLNSLLEGSRELNFVYEEDGRYEKFTAVAKHGEKLETKYNDVQLVGSGVLGEIEIKTKEYSEPEAMYFKLELQRVISNR